MICRLYKYLAISAFSGLAGNQETILVFGESGGITSVFVLGAKPDLSS